MTGVGGGDPWPAALQRLRGRAKALHTLLHQTLHAAGGAWLGEGSQHPIWQIAEHRSVLSLAVNRVHDCIDTVRQFADTGLPTGAVGGDIRRNALATPLRRLSKLALRQPHTTVTQPSVEIDDVFRSVVLETLDTIRVLRSLADRETNALAGGAWRVHEIPALHLGCRLVGYNLVSWHAVYRTFFPDDYAKRTWAAAGEDADDAAPPRVAFASRFVNSPPPPPRPPPLSTGSSA